MNTIKNVCVYSASSTQIASVYFEAAGELGRLLAEKQINLINGAGSIGLMAATSDAVLAAGGTVTGVIPRFMIEQGWHHRGLTRLIETETMHERKRLMADIKMKGKDAAPKEQNMYPSLQVVNEMMARGVEFLPVDIYKSTATTYEIEDGKIRMPFGALAGVGENAAIALAQAKEGNSEFVSIDDFAQKASASSAVIDALRQVGAFRDLPETRQMSLFDM